MPLLQIVLVMYADAKFQNTGLERTQALRDDIQWMQQTYNLPAPAVEGDGPGKRYALHLQQLARDDPQYFICHYYNYFFAHTAGGRMIGTKVCICGV
jgi:heme oxygenase